ncbi:hypothetical protein B5X24_HaOG203943 [Helicoverpa armigera]|uniref:FLYWCH-type domain-containing protein n=1 Tax=Helicoverpa armigera TaxID=29058 RepID=A0A2W1BPM6_HELAM|nr:hypothetical protein B5X24_HaOG203943 [Helicoverpa armigera]
MNFRSYTTAYFYFTELYYVENWFGNMTMVFRNERYNKSTDRDGRAAWRCVKRNKGCRSVVVTFMGAVVQCTEHNHGQRKQSHSTRFRRKLKEDPERYAEYLRLERIRDSKRRDEMRRKMEEDVSLRILARTRSKERMQAFRMRRKQNRQVIHMMRGGSCLLVFDYLYNRKRRSRDTWRWYCVKYHLGCKAAVLTNDHHVVVETSGEHNHGTPKLLSGPGGIYCVPGDR